MVWGRRDGGRSRVWRRGRRASNIKTKHLMRQDLLRSNTLTSSAPSLCATTGIDCCTRMYRHQPAFRIAWCKRPLVQADRRFLSSQKTASTDAPQAFQSLPPDWEDEAPSLSDFTELPKDFGKNQLMKTNEDFKRALRAILRRFPPVTYAFAYGSGVFPQSAATASRTTQSPHPNPPEAILKWQKGGGKMVDFILTPRFSQHFHSLNLREHRDHYSFLGSLGSGVVSHVQEKYGAGAYFNPSVVVH